MLKEMINSGSFISDFNYVEMFLLAFNVSQYFFDNNEIFMVKGWALISVIIVLYFLVIQEFAGII